MPPTGKKAGNQGGKNALAVADRRRRALELRQDGIGYAAIATRLGYRTPSAAWKAVRAGLRETLREPAEAVRRIELDRLDQITSVLWPAATAEPPNFKALDRLLKVMQRRAALLGLDALKKLDHTSSGGGPFFKVYGFDPLPPEGAPEARPDS
jgi:hypothetical protein